MSSSNFDEIVSQIRSRGHERIVFTNGCFDVLHPGHVAVLAKSRALAGSKGAVVVGLNDDESVKRLKGASRPVFSEAARAYMLLNLRQVDYVVTFSQDTPLELIRALRPDVIVKGGDYKASDVVGASEAMVVIAEYEDGWSTSSIIERMNCGR